MRTLRRLLRFLRPYRIQVVWCVALAAGVTAATGTIPYLIKQAIDDVRIGERDALLTIALVIVGIALLRLALTIMRRLVSARVSLGVEHDLANLLYRHVQRLELGFFDSQQTGQLISRLTVDLQAVRFFLGYGLIHICQSSLAIAMASVAMFLLEPALAAIALLPVPVVVISTIRYGRRRGPTLRQGQQRLAELTALVEENIAGNHVVKASAREQLQLERFRHSANRVFEQSILGARIQAFYNPFLAFLPSVGLAAVLFLGGRAVVSGALTTGGFAAFYLYLLMLIAPMRTLGRMLAGAQRASASGARLLTILDRQPRMTVPVGAPPLPAGPGHLELRNVDLVFEGARLPALRDINLTVGAGTTVAVIGATGAGKTALVSLLPRLYDATRGQVLIDGVDVRAVDPASLRREVAIVGENPFLFAATVHDNIAYGRSDATRADVERAARRAQAHEFVTASPHGYDTLIGERGSTLSGGQRQRLAVARALLVEPRILILDDATSAVDASTEDPLKQALREAMHGRTTFVVAHRLSTITIATDIVVMDHGRVNARGSQEHLLRVSALYRGIVDAHRAGGSPSTRGSL